MQQFLSAGLEQVFYATDLDCFVVLEQDGDTLFLQSVVCKKKTAMKKILKRIIMKKETEEFARNIKTEAEFPNSQRNMLYRKRAFSGSCAAQQQTEKNTVSRQLVVRLSSARDNLLFKPYQNGSKTPENQGFPGFYYI